MDWAELGHNHVTQLVTLDIVFSFEHPDTDEELVIHKGK